MSPPVKIIDICCLLSRKYPFQNLGNKRNPLNELLYIVISVRTTAPSTQRTYLSFKKSFPRWEKVYSVPVNKIARVLKNAGLASQKAHHLKAILQKIKRDWGILSLNKARFLNSKLLEEYLLSLPGIGLKSARCIMMYSFNRSVFPVDSHCFRIIKRLGWIKQDSKYTTKVQDKIQELIPGKNRYRLHINLIQHGRSTCFPFRPRCNVCFLSKFCNYYRLHKM
jgi:endonuclease III